MSDFFTHHVRELIETHSRVDEVITIVNAVGKKICA